MWAIGGLLIWLAIKKNFEPTLLLPMGFGAILVNLPLSGVIGENGIVTWLFEKGIDVYEVFPIVLFIGIGAMIDFGPLLSNPRMLLFGGAAQFGIFLTVVLAVLLGFDMKDAMSARRHRRGGRPHLHHGFPGAAEQLHGRHRRSGVFLHGARARHPAGVHPPCHPRRRSA